MDDAARLSVPQMHISVEASAEEAAAIVREASVTDGATMLSVSMQTFALILHIPNLASAVVTG